MGNACRSSLGDDQSDIPDLQPEILQLRVEKNLKNFPDFLNRRTLDGRTHAVAFALSLSTAAIAQRVNRGYRRIFGLSRCCISRYFLLDILSVISISFLIPSLLMKRGSLGPRCGWDWNLGAAWRRSSEVI